MKPDNEKKKRRSITATDAEWQKYMQAARALGIGISTWINITLKQATKMEVIDAPKNTSD